MEWYLQLVFHILHTFVLNVQLLRFTVRIIEHIENNREKSTKSTQNTQTIVWNEQTNTQTSFVKFCYTIIKNDGKGQCTEDKKLHFSTDRQPASSFSRPFDNDVDYQHKSGYIFLMWCLIFQMRYVQCVCLSFITVFYFLIIKICLLQVWVPGPMCSSSHTDITNLVNWILLGENQPSIHNIIHHLPGSSSSTKNDRVCGVSFVAIIVGNRCFIFLFPWQNVSLNKRMCVE